MFASSLTCPPRKSSKLMDVWVHEFKPRPFFDLTIDRARAKDLGLQPADIFNTLQAALGGLHVSDFGHFKQASQVVMPANPKSRKMLEDLKHLQIRDAKGQMIRLGSFATVQTSTAPRAIESIDGNRMVRITANPAAGVAVAEAEARAFCDGLLAETRRLKLLPAGAHVERLKLNEN